MSCLQKGFLHGAGLFLGVVCCALGAQADVWSDATYAWQFKQDTNGDGLLQANEVIDVRDPFNERNVLPESFTLATNGSGLAPQLSTEAVFYPARGITFPETSFLSLSATVVSNDTGILSVHGNGMTFPTASIRGECTLVARVRPKTFGPRSNGASYILFNGLNWTDDAGCEFGFIANDRVTFNEAYMRVLIGKTEVTPTYEFTLTTNRWYDVGYSLKDWGEGKIKVTVIVGGQMLRGHVDNAASTVRVFETVCTSTAFSHLNKVGPIMKIGGETIGLAVANSAPFQGDIQSIGMWNRALTELELREAIAQRATYFQAGVENDSNTEFAPVAQATAQPNVETAPWRTVARELSSTNPSLHFSYTPHEENACALGSLFRFKTTSTSEEKSHVQLKINGLDMGTRAVLAGGAAEWFVRGGTLQMQANDFEVIRKGTAAGVCQLDMLEFSGSWMLGYADNSQNEFSREGLAASEMLVMNWDWHSLARSFMGPSPNYVYATNSVWFYVPDSLARSHVARFESRLSSQGAVDGSQPLVNQETGETMGLGSLPFKIELNGEPLLSVTGMPNNVTFGFDIPRGTLSNGWNVLRAQINATASASYYLNFDYRKLEFIPNPVGTILIVR